MAGNMPLASACAAMSAGKAAVRYNRQRGSRAEKLTGRTTAP